MTAPDFASRLRELSAAASKGPWEADASDPSDVVVWGPRQNDDQRLLMNVGGANPHQVGVAFDIDAANAAFIAFTRNRADRIADVVDAVAAYRAARADGPVLSHTAMERMFAALDALGGEE